MIVGGDVEGELKSPHPASPTRGEGGHEMGRWARAGEEEETN